MSTEQRAKRPARPTSLRHRRDRTKEPVPGPRGVCPARPTSLRHRRDRTKEPVPGPRGVCPGGKRRYDSRGVARDTVRQMKARGDARAALLNTYRCSICDGWHVGHKA